MTHLRTFSFTAFTGAGCFAGGAGAGASLTVAAPTLNMVVADHNGRLSGDAKATDRTPDRSGRVAAIVEAGADIGNGKMVHAAQSWDATARGGTCYTLVEIRQRDSTARYYTFADGAPAAGAELILGKARDIGLFGFDYRALGAGAPWPDIPAPVRARTLGNGWKDRFSDQGDDDALPRDVGQEALTLNGGSLAGSGRDTVLS